MQHPANSKQTLRGAIKERNTRWEREGDGSNVLQQKVN